MTLLSTSRHLLLPLTHDTALTPLTLREPEPEPEAEAEAEAARVAAAAKAEAVEVARVSAAEADAARVAAADAEAAKAAAAQAKKRATAEPEPQAEAPRSPRSPRSRGTTPATAEVGTIPIANGRLSISLKTYCKYIQAACNSFWLFECYRTACTASVGLAPFGSVEREGHES